jgi:hypothetical protein
MMETIRHGSFAEFREGGFTMDEAISDAYD